MEPRHRIVRISFCRNSGQKRGQCVSAVAIAPTFGDIVKAAKNKLRLSKTEAGRARLFLFRASSSTRAGTELPRDAPFEHLLGDDATIAVSTGEDFIRPNGCRGAVGAPPDAVEASSMPLPPFWPWPNGPVGAEDSGAIAPDAVVSAPDPVLTSPSLPSALTAASVAPADNATAPLGTASSVWCGPYPVLDGPVLADLRAAIAGHAAFHARDRGEFVAFDYSTARTGGRLADIFAATEGGGGGGRRARERERWLGALRRECRGLLVCASSGRVLARRFHKCERYATCFSN